MTRVYNNQKVQYDLVDLVQLENDSEEALIQIVCDAFQKDGIPLNNIIGFAAM